MDLHVNCQEKHNFNGSAHIAVHAGLLHLLSQKYVKNDATSFKNDVRYSTAACQKFVRK